MTRPNYRLDENGIPILSRDAIELKAEEVIGYFSPDILTRPSATPLSEMALAMATEFTIPFVFDKDLGETESGRKVLGKFILAPRCVMVDASLEMESPRWRFTLAHELGHLVFHRSLRLVEARVIKRPGEISDTADEIDDLEPHPTKRRDWLEWQANKFAASLLMPRRTFRRATHDAMAQAGIDRRRTHIYLDNQACNVDAFKVVLSLLAETFRTSREATEFRLKELGLLHDDRLKNVRHITELLRDADN